MADGIAITNLSKNAERKQFKTPRLYKEAAKILEKVEKEGLGVKNCLFQAKHKNSGGLSAIVCQIIKNRTLLDHLISATELDKETNVNPFLLKVVINEQLFKNKTLNSLNKTVVVVKNKREALEKALAEQQSKPSKDLLEIPRYGRVNLLKTTLEEVVFRLESDGFVKVDYDSNISYDSYMDLVKNLTVEQFLHDLHVKNLLVFHRKTNFFKHTLYTSGKLLLQDKASCLPALCLNPPPGSFVLDACAAPGMKTTHLSAIMNNTGEILAMDKDKDRAAVLTTILESAGATNTQVKVQDFTTVNVNKKPYSLVDYILLDPSCSGSGMVKRSTIFEEESKDDDHSRIGRLTTFQKTMLMKALSFPNVKRVVYSTCSIHTWENEEVVSRALKQADSRFQLVNVNDQRDWPFTNSEIDKFPAARDKCIRTVPKRDLTNGFFVAVFERIEEKENSGAVPAEDISVNGENAEKPEIIGSKKSKGKKVEMAKKFQDTKSDKKIEDFKKLNGDTSSGNKSDNLGKGKKDAIDVKSDVAVEDFVKLDGDTKSPGSKSSKKRRRQKGRVSEHKDENEGAIKDKAIVPHSPAKLGKRKMDAIDVKSDVAVKDFVKPGGDTQSPGNKSSKKRRRQKKSRVAEDEVENDGTIKDFVKPDNKMESSGNEGGKKQSHQKKKPVAEQEDENTEAMDSISPTKKKKKIDPIPEDNAMKSPSPAKKRTRALPSEVSQKLRKSQRNKNAT